MLAKPEALTRTSLTRLAIGWREHPMFAHLNDINKFSMLHQETLLVLHHLASVSNGAILEIGAYMGGSTVAIGSGLMGHANPNHIIIEIGGAYTTHPTHSSTDILRDLKANIARYSLRGTTLIERFSNSHETLPEVETALAGRKIGLLFIDADGDVNRDWQIYRHLVADNAILVIDDVLMNTGEMFKNEPRIWATEAIENGLADDLGMYLWGTWVGRVRDFRKH